MRSGQFWQGIAAILLAVGVTGTLLTFAITGAVNGRMSPLTIEESSALTTVLGAVVGALAVYLGGARHGNGNGKPEAPPRADPENYAHIARTDPAGAERLAGPGEDNPAGLP